MDSHLNPLSDRHVVVLGAGGVIGSRLVETLALNGSTRVTAFVRNYASAPRIARYPIALVRGDVLDPEALGPALRGADVVVDCTYARAGTLDERCREARAAAERIAAASRAGGVRRIVHLGSMSAYGETPAGTVAEATPRRPGKDPYGASKLAAERAFLALHERSGLPVVVVQPTIVYGPWAAWTVGPLGQMSAGTIGVLDGGTGLCNAVYLDDVVDSILLAASRPGVEGRTYLVSGSAPVTWKEFYGAYEAMLRRSGTVSMSRDEVRAVVRQRARDARPYTQLLRQLRADAPLRQRVLRLPPIAQVYATLRALAPDSFVASVKSRLLGNGRGAGALVPSGSRPLFLPSTVQVSLYESRSVFSIAAAQRDLAYQPRFDLTEGMGLTAAWAEWARLTAKPGVSA